VAVQRLPEVTLFRYRIAMTVDAVKARVESSEARREGSEAAQQALGAHETRSIL
jgi:hypothetical protein